jgi:LPS-assembly lipoprotein
MLLESGGTTVYSQSQAPAYVLQLSEQSLTRNVLSVSAVTGKVEEYQLTLSARISIMDPDRNVLLAEQPVRVTRDFTFDDAAVLGSVQEQRLIEQEMTRQAATQIVRRLTAATRN